MCDFAGQLFGPTTARSKALKVNVLGCDVAAALCLSTYFSFQVYLWLGENDHDGSNMVMNEEENKFTQMIVNNKLPFIDNYKGLYDEWREQWLGNTASCEHRFFRKIAIGVYNFLLVKSRLELNFKIL